MRRLLFLTAGVLLASAFGLLFAQWPLGPDRLEVRWEIQTASASAHFRILDVRGEQGHLVIEVEHFNDDGTFAYFENYLFQGREGKKEPRVTNTKGDLYLDDSTVAPSIAGEQYLPDGKKWLRTGTPYLDSGSVLSVIEQIHQQRAGKPWNKGQNRLSVKAREHTQTDLDGVNALVSKLYGLRDTAYAPDPYGTLLAYAGDLPPPNPGLGHLEYGTVSTFYPDGHVESTSVDGRAYRSTVGDACEAWETLLTNAGNFHDDSGTTMNIRIRTCGTTPDWSMSMTGFTLYDTSSIPDTDYILSATADFVATSVTDNFNQGVSLVTTTPASDIDLVNADFVEYGVIKQGPDIDLGSVTADSSTYNIITLNSTGEGNISKTGITKFGYIMNGIIDTPNNPGPGTWASLTLAEAILATAEEVLSGDKRPRLVVTHSSIPPAAITGTAEPWASEEETRAGAETIIITLTRDTWVASGATFEAQRQNIINHITAGVTSSFGWNLEIQQELPVSAVVRDSDTVVTVTVTGGATSLFAIDSDETITVTVPNEALVTSTAHITGSPTFQVTAGTETVTVGGTLSNDGTEAEIRAGAETLTYTVSGAQVVAATSFDAQRQAILNGLDSGGSEANGWDATVPSGLTVTDVVRTSDTVITITLSAVATYDISANETITGTVPSAGLRLSHPVTGTPTFDITFTAATAAITGTLSDGATSSQIVAGGETAIITLTNTLWVAAGATFDAQRQTIIDNIDSASSGANGWDAERSNLAVTDVVRTSATVVTVTLSALASYSISEAETLTITVPNAAITQGSNVTATPTFILSPIYATTGNRVSPAIDLSSVTNVAYCSLAWEATTPTSTAITVDTSVNGGSSYTTGHTNGDCPAGITVGSSLASITDFRTRVNFTTSDTSVTASVETFALIIDDQSGQELYYQLNTAPSATLTDRSSTAAHTGTMSFPVEPSGVSSATGSLRSTRAALTTEQALTAPSVAAAVTGAALSDNLFNLTETGFASLPGQGIVTAIAEASDGLPTRFVWFIFIGFGVIGAGVLAMHFTQSLTMAAMTMGVGMGFWMAVGNGLLPGWTIFIFLAIASALILLRRGLPI